MVVKSNLLHIGETTKNQRGFTLLELIMALGILSMVLISVFSFYGTGIKAHRRLNNQFHVQQNIRQAILWLSTSIKQARFADIISKEEIQITTGNGEIIRFYLRDGVLYRWKNNGVNPIAQLKALEFTKARDNTIIVFLSGEAEGYYFEITTKGIPIGMRILSNYKNDKSR